MAEDHMHSFLECYADAPGVLSAMLVSDQGLIITHLDSLSGELNGVSLDAVAALVMDTVTVAQGFGENAGFGGLSTMLLDYDGMSLMLATVERDVMLVLVAEPGSFLVGCCTDTSAASSSPVE
jgi:predicted regulator of Ras-like GTPase activity (Roadblock/LC7/MglB family)